MWLTLAGLAGCMEIGRRRAFVKRTARTGIGRARYIRVLQLGPAGASPKPDVGPFVCKPVSRALAGCECTSEQNLKPPLSHPCHLAHALCPLTADSQTNEGRVGPVGPSTAPTRTPDGHVPTGTSTLVLKVPSCFPVLPAFVQNPSLTVFSPEELKESSPSPFGIHSSPEDSLSSPDPSKQANKQRNSKQASEARVTYYYPR